MIEQAKYWRKFLIKTAKNLEKRYRQKRWSARSYYNLEKEVFLGFFSIRKLKESYLVNQSLISNNHVVRSFPRVSTPLTIIKDPNHFLNNYHPFKGKDCTLSLKDLCNQFIHSFYFSPLIPENIGLMGFYFSSDWDKSKTVYYIQLIKVIEIFMSVGSDRAITLKLIIEKGVCSVLVKD